MQGLTIGANVHLISRRGRHQASETQHVSGVLRGCSPQCPIGPLVAPCKM